MSSKTCEQWATQKGMPTHELAAARVHNEWLAGQELAEEEYDAGYEAAMGMPLGEGSPQLPPDAVTRVLSQHRQNQAEVDALARDHAPLIRHAATLPPDQQTAALGVVRGQLLALHRQHGALLKAAAKGVN